MFLGVPYMSHIYGIAYHTTHYNALLYGVQPHDKCTINVHMGVAQMQY